VQASARPGGDEGRAEEGEQLATAAHRGAQRRLDPDGTQRLDLGGHPDDRRVARHQQQSRVAASEHAGVHLGLEEPGRALGQRLERGREALGALPAGAAQLAHQPEQLGPAQRHAEDLPHEGFHSCEPAGLVADRGFQRVHHLARGDIQDSTQQLVLGGEVVEDGLLADPQLCGDGVQRGGVDATRAERVQRGPHDALARLGSPAG
jgi:hypothetical protein